MQVATLPLEGGRNLAKTASGLCTEALWRLLTDSSETADNAVRRIGRSDRLMAEVREVGAEVARRGAAAGPTDIMAELVKLAPTYGIRDLSDGEFAELFSTYLRALAPLPLEAIREGIVQWTRDGNGFFPKPEQIFQRAEPFAHPLRVAAYRAKKAIDHVERNPPPKTAEERAADRQRAIDAGVLNPDGTVNLTFRTPVESRPRETAQQMADRLRKVADGSHPIVTDPVLDQIPEAI